MFLKIITKLLLQVSHHCKHNCKQKNNAKNCHLFEEKVFKFQIIIILASLYFKRYDDENNLHLHRFTFCSRKFQLNTVSPAGLTNNDYILYFDIKFKVHKGNIKISYHEKKLFSESFKVNQAFN
jgi:hypothetical protein